MKKTTKYCSVSMPILLTFVSLGPIGWFFIDLLIYERYDRLIFLFVISIILTSICTYFWTFYFRYRNDDKKQDNDNKY